MSRQYNWSFQNIVVMTFPQKSSVLRQLSSLPPSPTPLLQTCVCALLRSFACFVRLRLQRPRLGTAENGQISACRKRGEAKGGRSLFSASATIWKAANGGAKRIVRFAVRGGGERTIERPLQNHFWRLRKWDLSGLCLFPPKKMTWSEQTGGQNVS